MNTFEVGKFEYVGVIEPGDVSDAPVVCFAQGVNRCFIRLEGKYPQFGFIAERISKNPFTVKIHLLQTEEMKFLIGNSCKKGDDPHAKR